MLNYYAGRNQLGFKFSDDTLGHAVSAVSVSDSGAAKLTPYADGTSNGDTIADIDDLEDKNARVNTIHIGATATGVSQPVGFHFSDLRIYDFALNAAEAAFLAGE